MIIWRLLIARWIPDATNAHSENVVLITCPLQKWLQERALVLRYNTLPVLLINV
jgi:hypothetical protein